MPQDADIASPWIEGATPNPALAAAVSIETVRAAAERIGPHIKRTPVLTSRELDRLTRASVFLKCENLQRIGAFKIRGATSAITNLSPAERAAGVLTYSSGNHAQGVALAAATLGVRAVIIMPQNAPSVKLAATKGYLEAAPTGSQVVTFDPTQRTREDLAADWLARESMTLIPPYDHPDVISGQGTAALELFDEDLVQQAGRLDRLYVCCGGGGLLSGCATVAKAVAPECEVIGVEPAAADDATRSFHDGVLRTVHNPNTIADGARTPFLGRYTFPIVQQRVDRMETVSEQELAQWTLFMLERLRVVVEPSGVLGLAAAARKAKPGRVGVIISGGNLDLQQLDSIRLLAERTA